MKKALMLGLAFITMLPGSGVALVDTYEALILEPGESRSLFGTVYKSVSIHVKAGASIIVPGDLVDSEKWRLQLIAPEITIEGVIQGNGVSYNTQGVGLPGSGSTGPGGSGHGNKGGDGHNYPNSGGLAYDQSYRETNGSKGILNPNGGGGNIRLDAMQLTLGGLSRLNTNAYLPSSTGGGGSGGGIFLNGIHTFLTANYALTARGGNGQIHENVVASSTPTYLPTATATPGGGGGAGGRIKIIKYTDFVDQGGSINVAGGASGGGTALPGGDGVCQVQIAPLPNPPQLLTPNEGQVVGLSPTFTFVSYDPMLSQFLQYRIQISENLGFSLLVHENDQLSPDTGWAGREYFRSNEGAYYYMPPGILNPAQTYYWRVLVTNDQGATWSPESVVRSFQTSTVTNHPPLKPSLLAPLSGQDFISKTPSLQVLCADPDGNSLTFTVVLSQDPVLLNPDLFQTSYPGWDQSSYGSAYQYAGITATCQILNNSSYPDALQPGVTYFWKVIAADELEETNSSDISTFTVVDTPAIPVLLSPPDLGIVTTKNPNLDLTSTSPTGNPLQYRLELSSDNYQTIITFLSASSPGWTKTQYDSGETARLQIPVAYSLVPGKTYSWRAAAYDQPNDNWSDTSASATYQVITPPLLPQLVFPPDHYSAPDADLALQFYAVSESGNTLTYRCELSQDDFITTWISLTPAAAYPSGEVAVYYLPAGLGLERGRSYAWRVQAQDGVSWGPWSETRSFSLANSLEIRSAKVYPNPAVRSREVQVQMMLSVDAEITLSLFNILGKELKKYHFAVRGGSEPAQFTLDVSTFASGTYFCHIEAKSILGTRQVVKRLSIVK
ncbi:MAG: T9SS type A sorting domain-containing protein [candidate division FCPU426 bacterium]